MSGRKFTEVEFQRPITELLETHRKVEEKLQDIEAFGTSVHKFSTGNDSQAGVRQKIGEQLKMLQKDFQNLDSTLWDNVLEEHNFNQVQKTLQSILGELCQLESQCINADQEKVKIATLYHRLLQKKQKLQNWMPELFKKSEQRWEKILRGVEAILSGPSDSSVREGFVASMETLNQKLSATIVDCEQNYSRRLYALKAVKKSCEKMGFSIHSESQNLFAEMVYLEVDTKNHGTMTFNFTLPGRIRSSSHQAPGVCEKYYGTLEGSLKELGIVTEFRYENSERPLQKEAEFDALLQFVEDFYSQSLPRSEGVAVPSKN